MRRCFIIVPGFASNSETENMLGVLLTSTLDFVRVVINKNLGDFNLMLKGNKH